MNTLRFSFMDKTLPLKKLIRYAMVAGLFFAGTTGAMAQEDPPKRGEIKSNETGEKEKEKEKPKSEIKTLFGSNNIQHGGYGGASIVYTEFNGKGGLLIGGRGGWIINHCISIGMGGYGITNNIAFDNIVPDERVTLNGGYGGMYLEFIAFAKQPVHISFPILVGAGGVAYQLDRRLPDNIDPDNEYDYLFVDDDAFFVVEPGAEIELNVLRNFRVAFGVSYRYLGDLDIEGTESDAFDGIAGGITFKFGKF